MKKKKNTKKNTEVEIVELLGELMVLMEQSEGLFNKKYKSMSKSLIETFADVLTGNSVFHKMIADPKTDIALFEPVIKRMLKKKR